MKKVLLIDDDNSINKLNQIILSRVVNEPIEITSFNKASNALESIINDKDEKHIIFLDVNMPMMSGWDFLQALKDQDILANKEVYMLTSSVDPRDEERALNEFKINGFAVKPLTFDLVKARFGHLFELKN